MSKWILKAIVQKTISFLPNSNRINYWFQKHITKGVDLSEEYFGYKFEHLTDHIRFFLEASGKQDLKEESCLELGTGWYPIIPIGLFLKGAKSVITIDISPLLTTETFLRCIREIIKKEADFISHLGDDIRERFEILKAIDREYEDDTNAKLEDLCKLIKLEVIVVDARKLNMPDAAVSFITSNNTFEHVYPQVLKDILTEFWRVLQPGGTMSHFIDMSDHFAHMDSAINIYNFLQFSRKTWALIDNDIQPQNRWRFVDYKLLYDELGIPYAEKGIRPGDENLLATVKIHPELQHIPTAELAISHGYLVSSKVNA